MAQDPIDPETRGSGATDATNADRPAVEPAPSAEAQRVEQASPAPVASAPPKKRRSWLLATSAVAILGLAATAGSIAAYRFRDKHEKLAAFAALVDEYSAHPEKLVATLRETGVKWLGDAARPSKKPAPEPRQQVEAKIETKIEAKSPPKIEAKPEPKPAPQAQNNGERITWSAPPAAPAPVAPVVPAPTVAPPRVVAPAPAPEPPPKAAIAAPIDNEARLAEIEALTKRVDELEQIARSALDLAEQSRAKSSAGASAPSVPTAAFRELGDNVTGLEGRIDELGDEVKALRDRLDSPKDETRAPREAVAEPPVVEPPPRPAEIADEPNPAAVVVIAHSLQKALDRGVPYASELAALHAQGADKEALERLAPAAETGAPPPRALKTSFHPLIKSMEQATEPKGEESLSDRLLHRAAKLVKMKGPGEAAKAEISEIGEKIEQALDHDELGAALAAFADLPDEAKAVARDWEQTARRRLEAESAAASILSSAIATLGKTKSKS